MLTTKEAADRLGINARSVARLILAGRIAAEKRGRDYFIEEAEIERFKHDRRSRGRPRKEQTMYNPLTHYRQTEGGDFDSRPKAEDVRSMIDGGTDWSVPYADRGHNEYVENVCDLADMLRIDTTGRDIDQLVADLQPVDR